MPASCPSSSLLNPVLPFWNVSCCFSQCTALPHFLSQIVPELCSPPVKWHCSLSQRCGGPFFPIISSISKRSKLSLLCLGRRDRCGLSHPAGAYGAGCPIDLLLSREGSEIQPSNRGPDAAFPVPLIFKTNDYYFRKEEVISTPSVYQEGWH